MSTPAGETAHQTEQDHSDNDGSAESSASPVELAPPIEDDHGYKVTTGDLRYLALTNSDVEGYRQQTHPLGMQKRDYDQFVDSLFRAVDADELNDCDVRLQGSSAHFFSSAHKPMLYSREALVEELREAHKFFPITYHVDRIAADIRMLWPNVLHRPHLRMFDIMHKLRAHPFPSDYDVQISSGEIMRRAIAQLDEVGIDNGGPYIGSQQYNFIRGDLFAQACPHLTQWRICQSSVLGRPVTIAAFDAAGPPTGSGSASSRFDASHDWIMTRRSVP